MGGMGFRPNYDLWLLGGLDMVVYSAHCKTCPMYGTCPWTPSHENILLPTLNLRQNSWCYLVFMDDIFGCHINNMN
jgi:hypothetical protein